MDADGITVARALPIDAALVGDVLIRLRRDASGAVAHWTLGRLGVAELDVAFFPILTDATGSDAGAARPGWTTTARLWDPEGLAMLRAVVELRATDADQCELTICPEVPLAPWWSGRLPELMDLAHATLDELGEELLWHATREGVATHRDS